MGAVRDPDNRSKKLALDVTRQSVVVASFWPVYPMKWRLSCRSSNDTFLAISDSNNAIFVQAFAISNKIS